MPPRQDIRTLVWLETAQVGLVQTAGSAAGVRFVVAGSPTRGHSGGVAGELGAAAADDLRAAIAAAEVDLILIASPGDFGSLREDAAAVLAAKARGVRIATLEPVPASALDLTGGGWLLPQRGGRPIDAVRFVPLARQAAVFREATEVIEQFGPARAVSVQSWCGAGEVTTGARLFSALELVDWLMGEPETIDAAYVSPAHGQGVHALPGETLFGLRGEITANMRYSDGRAAAVIASDGGGRWGRAVDLVGGSGRLRFFDDGFEWIGPDGLKADEARKRTRGKAATMSFAARAVAEQLQRLLDPAAPEPGPSNHASVLAMAQAALLSARTGQGESPATMRRMAGAE